MHRLRLAESDAVHFGIQVPNRYHTYRYHTGNKTTVTVHVSYRYHTVTTHRYPTGIPQVTYRYPIGNISTGTLQYHTGATHTHTHRYTIYRYTTGTKHVPLLVRGNNRQAVIISTADRRTAISVDMLHAEDADSRFFRNTNELSTRAFERRHVS